MVAINNSLSIQKTRKYLEIPKTVFDKWVEQELTSKGSYLEMCRCLGVHHSFFSNKRRENGTCYLFKREFLNNFLAYDGNLTNSFKDVLDKYAETHALDKDDRVETLTSQLQKLTDDVELLKIRQLQSEPFWQFIQGLARELGLNNSTIVEQVDAVVPVEMRESIATILNGKRSPNSIEELIWAIAPLLAVNNYKVTKIKEGVSIRKKQAA